MSYAIGRGRYISQIYPGRNGGGGGGAINPLSTVLFVDGGAPAGGNGSIAAPFQTIQAAVDAIPAGSPGGAIYVTPRTAAYSAVVIPSGTFIAIIGMSGGIGTSSPRVTISSVTIGASSILSIVNAVVTGNATGVSAPDECGLVLQDAGVALSILGTGLVTVLTSSACGSANCSSIATREGSNITGSVTLTNPVVAPIFADTEFSGTLTFVGAAGQATFDQRSVTAFVGGGGTIVNGTLLAPGCSITRTVSVNLADVPANSTVDTTGIAFLYAAPGDQVRASPSAALDTGVMLGEGFCTVADQVSLRAMNTTGGNINPGAQDMAITVTKPSSAP